MYPYVPTETLFIIINNFINMGKFDHLNRMTALSMIASSVQWKQPYMMSDDYCPLVNKIELMKSK